MISELVAFSSVGMAMLIAILCGFMVTRYKNTKHLGMAFVFLMVAFVFYFVGETLWYLYDHYGQEAYGNMPDFFYVGYYAFAILHVTYTLSYFKTERKRFTNTDIMFVSAITMTTVLGFLTLAQAEETEIGQIWYSLGFVGMSALLISFSCIAVIRIQNTLIFRPWILIGLAILVATIFDVLYWTVEIVSGYEYGQYLTMDIAWFVTDVIILIGIILHRKCI